MAAARAIWEFFRERVRLEAWAGQGLPLELDVGEPPHDPADVPLAR